MAKPHYGEINQIIAGIALGLSTTANLKVKHFFNGATVFADGKFCITLSPAGITLKLSNESFKHPFVVQEYIRPLNFFFCLKL